MTDAHDDPAQEVDELRSEIAGTRAEMDETITEIEERLDPGRVLQQQTTRVREQLDDVPVAAVAGGAGGLAALGTVTTILRRRRAQAQLQQRQREQATGGLAGLGALLGTVTVLKLVRGRRRRRRMPTVRQVMTPDVARVLTTETLETASQRMAQHDVGALPVCGPDGDVQGMLTDRDIVVTAVARGDDPRIVQAGSVASTDVVTVDADEPIAAALQKMSRSAVRRLPVVDGSRLVGMVSQADLAVHLADEPVGDLVEDISEAPGDRR